MGGASLGDVVMIAQDRIGPAEASLAFRFEPGEDIVVNAEGDLRFEGTIVFSDHPLRPLRGRQLGHAGMIETAIPLLVKFAGSPADLS